MSDRIDAMSPLGRGLAVATRPGSLTIAEIKAASIVHIAAFAGGVTGASAALSSRLGTKIRFDISADLGQTVAAVTGPGRLVLISDLPDLAAVMRDAEPEAAWVVTDLTSARAGLRLWGEKAVWVLNKGLALDFRIRAFPAGHAAQSSVHGMGIMVIRRDERVFDLWVPSSFAQSFGEWIADACADIGFRLGPAATIAR